ncbi:MAG TPA: 30S ribosome-binding factor RbfA [Candidatus Aveggerthella stercoripullorum]|uniref:Ribosome-binding factor A n=1 Tax=Candidatus Aveggerthella stercoripullorum TaxID=2840688 RepID=A0A9D1A055_9ACTN|nr:30S ribosome-binding factor RbfA [Candidatus Aveggerthella stercoripullorum]
MKQGASSRKVNEQAREVIASILLFDISDPRLRAATITGCEVSFDRSYCNVYYTTEPDRYSSTAKAFARAAGRIRSLMARQLSWRVAPELRFILDPSVDEAERISTALMADAARNADSAAKNAAYEAELAAEEEGSAVTSQPEEDEEEGAR